MGRSSERKRTGGEAHCATSRCRNAGITTARRQVWLARSTNFGIHTRQSFSMAESVCPPFASGWGIRTCKPRSALLSKLMRPLMQKYEPGAGTMISTLRLEEGAKEAPLDTTPAYVSAG